MIGKARPLQNGTHARSNFKFCVLGLFVLFAFFEFASAQNTISQFSLKTLNSSKINCLQNSSLTPLNHTLGGAICLTPADASNTPISGRCYYKDHIQFPEYSNFSFSTMFSFNTLKFLQYDEGEGFTFFIAGEGDNASSVTNGGYLGLSNEIITKQSPKSKQFFAVEFDLYDNNQSQFEDPPYQHVGIDVNSMISKKTSNLPKFNITSTSTIEKIYAWIDYDGRSKRVDVSLSKKRKKPCKTLLTFVLEQSLSEVLTNPSIIGFSSSTGSNSTLKLNSQTTVWDWSFNASGPAEDIYDGQEYCGLKVSWSVIAAIVVSFLSVGLILMLGLVAILHRRASKQSEENESLIQENADLQMAKERLVSELKLLDFGAREFTYQQLKEATGGFTKEIGRGGFGTVFKGTLQGVGSIAVKEIRRTEKNVDDAKQLVAEVQVIGRLRHVNIVPLRGWCYEQGVMLLVYEFVDNADLHTHLFPKNPPVAGGPLSWEKRIKALRGVAAALVFLHEEFESEERVLHRDVKPTNVMLDSKFNARLGDFGLARLSKRTASGHRSENFAFTPGYVAPEYYFGATVKTDVYSFGVLALVVATGRMPMDSSIPEHAGLVGWVRDLYDEGTIAEAGDPALRNGSKWSVHDKEEMEAVLKVGLSCCLYEPGHRPTMREALTALQGMSTILSSSLTPQFPASVDYPLFEDSGRSFWSNYSDSASTLNDSFSSHYNSSHSFNIKIGSGRR